MRITILRKGEFPIQKNVSPLIIFHVGYSRILLDKDISGLDSASLKTVKSNIYPAKNTPESFLDYGELSG
jgi:hypothetical protein